MKPACQVADCDRPAETRGWCSGHYKRWQRHGDPLAGGPLAEGDREARLWFIREAATKSGTDADPCIDWPWPLTKGYPRIAVGRTTKSVHHFVLEGSGRPRPPAPGNHSLHSCDRPVCIAPYHLRWGTNAENMADLAARGRWRNQHAPLPASKEARTPCPACGTPITASNMARHQRRAHHA